MLCRSPGSLDYVDRSEVSRKIGKNTEHCMVKQVENETGGGTAEHMQGVPESFLHALQHSHVLPSSCRRPPGSLLLPALSRAPIIIICSSIATYTTPRLPVHLSMFESLGRWGRGVYNHHNCRWQLAIMYIHGYSSTCTILAMCVSIMCGFGIGLASIDVVNADWAKH